MGNMGRQGVIVGLAVVSRSEAEREDAITVATAEGALRAGWGECKSEKSQDGPSQLGGQGVGAPGKQGRNSGRGAGTRMVGDGKHTRRSSSRA